MKKIGTIVLVVVAIFVLVAVGKNIIAKTALSAGVKAMTGLKLSMKSMNVGVVKTLLGIDELKLYNPAGFTEPVMVDMPEIYVDYDLGAFLKKRVHLEEVRVDLKEFVVVKNEKGELNLDSLKVVKEQKEEKAPPEEKKERAKMPEFQIDVLELKIGKVIYKDYSKGTPPQVREYDININERYENITNPYSFATLIVVRALTGTTIAKLANFDLSPLKDAVSGTLQNAKKVATETVDKAIETGKEIGEKATDTAKEAVDKVQDTIKDILPTGK